MHKIFIRKKCRYELQENITKQRTTLQLDLLIEAWVILNMPGGK